MHLNHLPDELRSHVHRGTVIPAMPLALDAARRLDTRHQQALIRYYLATGAGGLAVGVHSTQFEIREPGIDLFEPVLALASQVIDDQLAMAPRPFLKVAGVCGATPQAAREAIYAQEHGYHASLLSLAAVAAQPIEDILQHCRHIAGIMPLIGFYLQPAVGGRVFPYAFWRAFAEIDNVLAIKMAPFNRYHTLDVIRAVCDAGREHEIALYTGNDDNIIVDLLTPYRIITPRGEKTVRIVGGLLGHWAVWTRSAVELHARIQRHIESGTALSPDLLTLAIEVTDCNAAFFDAANGFAGCIPGIHEVLHRQGLLQGTWCLNPHECLSPGQYQEIDRVHASYPHLHDDDFVRTHLQTWLGTELADCLDST